MDAILSDSTFIDFGEDGLFPFSRTGLSRVEGDTPESLRSAVRQFVPRTAGVYGMIDTLGRLIYVGKSKALRNRLLSYFLPNNEEDKAGRIVQSTAAIVWEWQPSEFAALLREQNLIRTFQPRYNVQGMPRRQQPIYICLGRGPAEQLYTSRQNDPKAISVIGPVFGAGRAARAVEVLNRVFQLRDCSSKQPCSFTDQLQLFDIGMRPGCIRLEIGSCLGPCISACSRGSYAQKVGDARGFLEGRHEEPMEELQRAMQQAAGRMHFEQAAVLREDLRAVTWLSRRAHDMARARDTYTFVYPVPTASQPEIAGASRRPRDIWYLVRRGVIEGALAAPLSDAEQRRTRLRLKTWLADDNCVGSTYTPRPETLALVASWFRNNRGELAKTFIPGVSRAPARSRRRKSPAPSSVKV